MSDTTALRSVDAEENATSPAKSYSNLDCSSDGHCNSILKMSPVVKLDSLNERILEVLQEDATLSVQEIGDRIGLSTTPCWRRIKYLEAAGVIDRRVAVINPTAIGLSGTVFIFIRTSLHDAAWLRRFAAAISELPEIVECHRLAGTIDYLIKCVVRDIDHYDELYKRLILRVPGLVDISASFSMERLKQVTKVDCTTAR